MQAFPGEAGMVALPDYPSLTQIMLYQADPERETLPEFMRRMGEWPRLHISDKVIECRSGTIFLRSADALNTWEGSHLFWAWLDEHDLMPLDAYRRALERTRMRNGYVLLTGTPRKVGWIKTELEPLWQRGDPFMQKIQFPSTANPRYSPEAMAEAQRTLPAWLFKRLHLGELAAMEGGNVVRREWWKEWTVLPPFQDTVLALDTAYKKGAESDFSVGAVWGRNGTGFYLVDLWRAKVEFPELCRSVKALYEKHRPGRVLVEDAASGQSLIQQLQRETVLPVVPVKVDRDKFTRVSAITGLIEAGRCYLPGSALWLHDFVEEHAEFPAGEHDDQVDSTSIALGFLSRGGGWRPL